MWNDKKSIKQSKNKYIWIKFKIYIKNKYKINNKKK
jgi:hypothetical protein